MTSSRSRRVRGRLLRVAIVSLACGLVVLGATRPSGATTLLALDLDDLTASANRIFMGRVVAVRSGRDDHGLPATWTTFAVDETLKGAGGARLEIKQLGIDTPLADGTVFRVPALPSYRIGDEVLLFLHPDSRAGFTSPVGLGQGRFRIRRDGGSAVAENDVGNRNLHGTLRGARALAAAPSGGAAPIAVDELRSRIRASIGAAR